ncbi:MAG: hypothetical protein AAF512_21055 [Pseudomonadota bacterium]
MNTLEKLHTALRGAMHDAVTDKKKTSTVQPRLIEAREELVKLVRTRMSIERESVKPRKKLIERYEIEIEQALDLDDKTRARTLSEKVEQTTQEIAEQIQLLAEYERDIENLKTAIQEAEQQLAVLQNQTETYHSDYEAAAKQLEEDFGDDVEFLEKLRAAGITTNK